MTLFLPNITYYWMFYNVGQSTRLDVACHIILALKIYSFFMKIFIIFRYFASPDVLHDWHIHWLHYCLDCTLIEWQHGAVTQCWLKVGTLSVFRPTLHRGLEFAGMSDWHQWRHSYPGNTRHCPNVVSMMCQRLRHSPSKVSHLLAIVPVSTITPDHTQLILIL